MRISFWPGANQSWGDILALARHVEATGWDGFWIADHFMPDEEDVSAPCHEAWSVIAALSASVPRLRLGTMVLSNTYRHPAVLAKMAATTDHISGGRLVLGLGAGWQQNEHIAYGLEYSTVRGRLQWLEDACQIIKGLHTQSRFNFNSERYQLVNAPLEPKPVQNPIPLMIGGGGEKVTLRIVSRYADEWNVWGDVTTFAHKSRVLDQHCERGGRNPADVQRSVAVLVALSDDPGEVARIRAQPHDYATIAGNSNELSDILGAYQEAGLNELIFPDFDLPPGNQKFDILDRFIEQVGHQFQG